MATRHEQVVWCSSSMSMEQLQQRREYLAHSLRTYHSNAEEMDEAVVCPSDPLKFRKLKRHCERRLRETEEFIRTYLEQSDMEIIDNAIGEYAEEKRIGPRRKVVKRSLLQF